MEKKSEEYSTHRDKNRRYLDTYETVEASFPLFGIFSKTEKVKKINYNYYCVEDKLNFIEPSVLDAYLLFLNDQIRLLNETANRYGIPWQDGEIKANGEGFMLLKPILFCEGDIDITLIRRAAELLEQNEIIEKLDLRYRGSCNKLDSLWTILTENNWETVPQKKILLYDCDTNRENGDFGHIFRRTIPKIEENTIQRGIENLFSEETIKKATDHKREFVDFKFITGTERGKDYKKNETIINKHEKRNFCNWIVANATKEDFKNFTIIFEMIDLLL